MRLFDFLDYQSAINSDVPFLVKDNKSLSYLQGQQESIKLAAYLLKKGVTSGDRVAILSKNSIEYILFYYACSRIGAVCVPLNFRLAANEWSFILDNAQAKLLLCSTEFLPAITPVLKQLNQLEKLIVVGEKTEQQKLPSSIQLSHYSDVPALSLSESTALVEPISQNISEDDIVYQMYTSGTTGTPKGVVVSNRNVGATVHQLALNTPKIIQGGDWILILPVFHAAAALHCFSAVQAAATLHIQEEFSPVDFVETLVQKNINVVLAVPAIIKAVLALVPNLESYDFSRLELFVYGASPIDKETLTKAIEVFSCDFCQGYGMTESTLTISMLRPDDHIKALGSQPELLLSAGRAVLGTQISIRDTDDKVLPANEVGEVCTKGPQVMQSYWNRADASKEALRNGWLHTGDAGYLDNNGYLYIVDRVKDMIISGGENIYPKEVEQVLLQHESVQDVALIGIPDEKWGEQGLAFIVLAPGSSLDSQALDKYCRAHLASYKCPKQYKSIEALPLNVTGKVLKKELRKPYWDSYNKRQAG